MPKEICLDEENAKHIEILNREMGETRDAMKDLDKKNEVAHTQMASDIKSLATSFATLSSDFKEIKQSFSKFWIGLISSVVVIIISIVLATIFGK